MGIQPYGHLNIPLTDSISSAIKNVYGFQAHILKQKPIPESAFINIKSPRYRADSLLKVLKQHKPDTIDYIIGLLNQDISTTKRDHFGNVLKPKHKYTDWGVFGLGYRPGVSCVVSTYRVNTLDTDLYYTRIKKICTHEIGHNLGLKHCEAHKKCVMRDAAESILTIDSVDLFICSSCQTKLVLRSIFK